MHTLIVSDLHLGLRRGNDLVRRPEFRRRLIEALTGADRVVFLGDLMELRECTVDEGVAAAEPLFRELGEAIGPAAEVIVVPGNHDHALAAPLLEPLGGGHGLTDLEHRHTVSGGEPLAPLAVLLGDVGLHLAYPGLWLADGVYAMHGHYMDVHSTVPTFECLAIAGFARTGDGPPPPGSSPADYERIVGPVYRAASGAGRAVGAAGISSGANLSTGVWARLAGNGGQQPTRPPAGAAGEPAPGGLGGDIAALSVKLLSGAVAPAVAAVNRAGLGPFDSDFSGAALRRSGLRSVSEVARRLRIDAEHIVFGHTHRSGPLPRDDEAEWSPPGGPRLHNTGCWVHEPAFTPGAPGESPYWPGKITVIEDGGEPELRGVLDDLEMPAAEPPRGP